MRTLRRLILPLLCLPIFLEAQTSTIVQPPCTLNFTFNSNATSGNLLNQAPSCDKWTMTVYNTPGVTGFSVLLQDAPFATATTPGTFVTYIGTTATGSNPATATGISTFTNGTAATPFLRLTMSGFTGSGAVIVVLQGTQTLLSKGGGGGGGGGPNILGTANEITATGAGCTSPSTSNCTISIPNNPILPGVVTAAGFSSSESLSGSLQMVGLTSGQIVLAVDDIAGTAIVYVWPSTNGTAGQVLSDSGSVTCPTLPAGYPTTCHQLTWIAAGGGSGFAVQVNGAALTGLTTLNMVAGSNMTLTPAGSGTYTVTFASTGSAGGGVLGYSASALTLPTAGTTFLPPIGGALASTTEANVTANAPAAAAISNMYVALNSAPGLGNSVAFTYRDQGSSTALTCTISGASATSCNDTTHSFTPAVGDALAIQVVTAGTVVIAPAAKIIAEYGVVAGPSGPIPHHTYYAGGTLGGSGGGSNNAPSMFNLTVTPTTNLGGGSPSNNIGIGVMSANAVGTIVAFIPSTWNAGNITLTLDVTTSTNGTGNYSFTPGFFCATNGTDMANRPAFTTGTTVTQAAPGGSGTGFYRESVALTISGAGCSGGNTIEIQAVRGGSDTYSATMYLVGADLSITY